MNELPLYQQELKFTVGFPSIDSRFKANTTQHRRLLQLPLRLSLLHNSPSIQPISQMQTRNKHFDQPIGSDCILLMKKLLFLLLLLLHL